VDTEKPLRTYYDGGAVWGDFNNNGFCDLIVFGQTSLGDMVHRYNNIAGDISVFQQGTNIGAVNSGDISAADCNGNGILDIAITGWPGALNIYAGRGNGFFDNIFSGSKFQNSSVSWVDIDADGDLDLFATGYDKEKVAWKSVVVHNSVGVFTEVEQDLPGFQDGSVAFADYNTDGWPDIAITGTTYYIYVDGIPMFPGAPISVVYKNLGYGEFEEVCSLPPLENGTVAWFDYNADGYIDLFISGKEEGQIPEERLYIYKNAGPPNYELVLSTWLTGVESGQVICGDINNDGYGDFFIVGSTSTSTVEGALARFYTYDNGSDLFQLYQELPGLSCAAAAFYDYNNDGKLDLFYCGVEPASSQGKSFLYENQEASANLPPLVPSNAEASVSEGYLVLQWDAPDDDNTLSPGLNYSLRVGSVSFSSNTISGCLATPFLGYNPSAKLAGAPGINLAGIKEGVTYFWSVRAIDSAFASGGWTEEQFIFVAGVPPSSISNLTALPGSIDGAISLKWTAPGNDGTFGKCVSYDVRYSSTVNTISDESGFASAALWTQSWKPKIGGWTESKSLTGLMPGVTYYFGIRASDGFSYGTWGSGASANSLRFAPAQDIVPSSPTWTAGLSPGDSYIVLNWDLNTEIDISSYTVEMSTLGGAFQHVASTAHPVNTLSVAGLINFTTYYFRIRSSDWTGHISTWSAVKSGYPFDTTPPDVVDDLSAVRSLPGKIRLSWSAPGDSWNTPDDLIDGRYEISYATYSFAQSTGAFASNMKISFSTSVAKGLAVGYSVTGLYHDTTYYFRLRTAVTALTGETGQFPGAVSLSWISPGDNAWSGNLSGNFRIDYDTYSLSLSSQTAKKIVPSPSLAPGSALQCTVTGLLAGTSYYLRLWSFDEENNSSYASNIATAAAEADSNPPDVTILIPIPPLPLKSYGRLWEISGTAADNYGTVSEVRVSTGSASGPWHFAQITAETWSFDCSTFTFMSGRAHTILARAKDSYGNETSSYTVGISSVSFYYDNQPPDEVSGMTASTGALSGVIELAWTAPCDQPKSDMVTGYILKYASYTISDTTAWWEQAADISAIAPAPGAPGTSESATVSGLTPGCTYWFALKSYDGIDYYNSTSAVSNIPFHMARYGPDAVTKFRINIATEIVKGVPATFSVSCHNPHYETSVATEAVVSVSFSGTGCQFYPSSYDFILEDGGTKTFSKALIFTDFGDRTFQVAAGGIIAYSNSVLVSSSPFSSIGSTGGVVSASDDIKLVIPAGALSSNQTLRLNMVTDNADIPSYSGSTIAASACEIKQLAGDELVFNTAATLTLSFLDNDADGNEDKTGVSENSLGLFFYDGKAWRVLDDDAGLSALSVATGNVFVSKVYRTGKYAIFPLSGVSRSVSGVKPKRKIITPYAAGSNDFIEFTGATEPFTLAVYSASGKKVFEAQNSYTWAGVTTGGAKVPGGIYFYEMVSPVGTITGAVVVAR